jgi:hypothetical protein
VLTGTPCHGRERLSRNRYNLYAIARDPLTGRGARADRAPAQYSTRPQNCPKGPSVELAVVHDEEEPELVAELEASTQGEEVAW